MLVIPSLKKLKLKIIKFNLGLVGRVHLKLIRKQIHKILGICVCKYISKMEPFDIEKPKATVVC